ncbi:MAG: hypothetical protein SCH71_07205 [Desulfobulbaceae bacterium]|nr:hypothetical protein [Desulfobulbaceae bacterium]
MLLIVPLCLGLSGMNHIFYYTTLTFQMYVAVVLLLCLLLFPPPQSIPGTVFLYIAAVFLIWSGPYSVVAIPLSVSLIILFPEKKRIYLLSWVILWTLIYLQFTSEGMVKIENIFDPVIRKKMFYTMFYDVFFLRTFGQAAGIKIFLFLSLIAGIFYSQRKNKEYIKYSIVFMVLIISSITPLFLSEKIFYYKVHKPCNILISQFFWLAFILYTFDTCLCKIKSRFIHVSAIIIIVVFISYDNYIHVDKRKMVLDETASDFLTAIYHAEQLNLAESNQFVILKRISPGAPFFTAWVPVGNTNPGAGQLLRDEVELPAGNEFVSNVYYRR